MSAFLRAVHGPKRGLQVALSPDRPLTIGRRAGDILLDDPLVSGAHCRILFKQGGWVLVDLGSTNGTTVDGRLVREAPLRPGCDIVVGNSKFSLFVGDPQEAPGAQPGAPTSLELAWLLDAELVELRPTEKNRGSADVIGQELRLPPGINVALEVLSGVDAGRVYRVKRGTAIIGRKVGDVPLSDLEISRNHAQLEVFGREMIFVRDLGSTNGTYINGRRVGVGRVTSGDTIGCGRSVLRLQLAAT